MKINVRVKPNARKDEVTVQEDGSLLVHINAPPVEGRANEKLVEILAKYFGKPKRNISIVVGNRGKYKIIEVL